VQRSNVKNGKNPRVAHATRAKPELFLYSKNMLTIFAIIGAFLKETAINQAQTAIPYDANGAGANIFAKNRMIHFSRRIASENRRG
jgi:hypothetical protein